MSRTTTVAAAGIVGLGTLAIALAPVLRLVVLAACLGLAPLALFLMVESLVGLARLLSPARSAAWLSPRAADQPGVVSRAFAMEAAISVGAVSVLAVTAPWWEPVLGIAPPLWLIAAIALRSTATALLVTLATLRRPIAALAVVIDLVVVLPLASLFGSLGGAVIASAVMTWGLLALALQSAPIPVSDQDRARMEVPHDRWRLGNWLSSIATAMSTVLFAGLAGVTAIVPLMASTTLAVLIYLVFVALTRVRPSRSRAGARFARGLVLATLAVLVGHELGPALYRALYPASFGDGAWLEILAWSGLVVLPAALWLPAPPPPSQWRRSIAALIQIALTVTLAVTHGAVGVLWAIAASSTIGAVASRRVTSEVTPTG